MEGSILVVFSMLLFPSMSESVLAICFLYLFLPSFNDIISDRKWSLNDGLNSVVAFLVLKVGEENFLSAVFLFFFGSFCRIIILTLFGLGNIVYCSGGLGLKTNP